MLKLNLKSHFLWHICMGVCVCVFFFPLQQVGNLLSKGTWRLQWSKNFVLVANSPPHVGHPTSFSCVWLLTWSANLYTERKTDLQPAEWKSWYFSMGIILSTSLFTIIRISWHTWFVPKVSVLIFYLNVYWTQLKLQVISFKIWPLGSYTVVPFFPLITAVLEVIFRKCV